jgi:hypothetical protein
MKRDKGYRIHNRDRIIKNRKRLLKSLDKDLLDVLKDAENRMSKKHPLDCGNTKCGICSAYKKHPSKNKDEHDILEDIIKYEAKEELLDD